MQDEYKIYVIMILSVAIFDSVEMENLYADCGIRSFYREPRYVINQQNGDDFYNNTRNPKIMYGIPTKEGQYPWQVSLELLHPSYGFIGHWCGGVLIDESWIISAAHCVHNDLFNLPLPALWTVVLGEHDRTHESGHEQRIPVEKIVMHEKYHHFKHDIVLMKLSRPAKISISSQVAKICLPFADLNFSPQLFRGGGGSSSYNNQHHNLEHHGYGSGGTDADTVDDVVDDDLHTFESMGVQDNGNYLRSFRRQGRQQQRVVALPEVTGTARQHVVKVMDEILLQQQQQQRNQQTRQRGSNTRRLSPRKIIDRRRNDKFANGFFNSNKRFGPWNRDIQMEPEAAYYECIATGWGVNEPNSELSKVLLQTKVPIHANEKCDEVYSYFVKLHRGHLCAGNLNKEGGTCVGDSGGPLQCRLSKKSPWILVGITSFGSGCSVPGFPDVYTKISYYRKWIVESMKNNND